MKTRSELYTLRNRLRKLVNASARAWERGNNSGDSAIAKQCNQEERTAAAAAEALVTKECPGVTMDWPGLYPCFKVGRYEEVTIEGMLCSHFGLARNYFKQQ